MENFSPEGQALSDIGLVMVSSNLDHYTKVFGAIIALSRGEKIGGKRKLRFFPLSPFPLFALL